MRHNGKREKRGEESCQDRGSEIKTTMGTSVEYKYLIFKNICIKFLLRGWGGNGIGSTIKIS